MVRSYKKICSCVDDVNKIHGFSLLLNFTHDFTLVTSQIFHVHHVWSSTNNILSILPIVLWIIPNVVKISLICFACHLTKNSVSKEIKNH